MFIRKNLLILAVAAAPACAFVSQATSSVAPSTATSALASSLASTDEALSSTIRRELNYKAGAADTVFAQKYKTLAGQPVRTVGEAFAAFTEELQLSINPLYKSMVTDLVGTTHLILVNARFERDPVWSLGILTSLDMLLKHYPEPETAQKIVSALFTSVGLDEAEIRAEAATVTAWLNSGAGENDDATVSRADVEAALMGQGDSPVAVAARKAKDNEFWMYSRYFGIGLLQMMQSVGIAMDRDEVYPVMEDWMSKKMGRPHLTACADSDMFFRIKDKLDIMETMMKEIEIREKKRMAERLEDKAEAALRAADREEKFQAEIAAEQAAKEPVEV